MAIPSIAPYPMPAESELPRNRVAWQADPARAVVLVHDMQRYFLNFFPSEGAPTRELVRNIRILVDASRELGIPVAYTAQPGGMDRTQRGLLRDFWGPGMSVDPSHREIIDEIAPTETDVVLTKWRYSAFHSTGLKALLDDRDRDQLIICGVYAHVGCLLTACDAFAFDVQSFLMADGIADFTPEEHRMALEYVARRCGAVVSSRNLVDVLTRQDPSIA